MGERGDNGEKLFADLRLHGVPESEIAALKAEHRRDARSDTIEIEPENRDTVLLFIRAMSQWRTEHIVAGDRLLEMRTGLDYGALPTVATALGVTLNAQLLDGIRIMEAESLRIHRRRQEDILRRR